MEQARTFNRNKRRKRILLSNTLYSAIGYIVPISLVLTAMLTGMSSISLREFLFITGLNIFLLLAFTIVIQVKAKFTRRFGVVIGILQLIAYQLLLLLWILTVNEIRVTALIVSFLPLIFQITTLNFKQSLIFTIIVAGIYLAASYIAIEYLHQAGSFTRELFNVACFIPAASLVSVFSGRFTQQREEIRQAKQEVERANDALWGEMQLAKKIQTILLPRNPSMTGFEVEAYMDPAVVVGGDYYDVINVDGLDWLIIGDVSGHGVPAGLIMMMVQTSIHTTIDQNPHMDPSEILSIVNRTIRNNILQLGEDKYMTITVLAAIEDGEFRFSGLHQDIMIYRNASSFVEIIETHGMWLGVMDEIREELKTFQLQLDVGDVMLLYTDGITEAWIKGSVKDKRDPITDMFGSERLKKILARMGDKPIPKIKQAILKELKAYEIHDDVTIVIVRRIR